MNTTGNPRGQRADNDRSHAIQRAESGADAWREALNAHRAANPDHSDFYALAGEMVETLRMLDAVAGVLARHVGGYHAGHGDGAGREVYDDEGANPAHRLRAAVLALAETRHGLAGAERAANRFWSAIGHIGVRYQDGGRP
jgi:hypothetical protein